MALNRNKLKQRRTQVVLLDDILGEGESVTVRAITPRERAEYEMSMVDKEGKTIPGRVRTARERLVIIGAIDDHGQPLFSAADLAEMSDEWDTAALDRMFLAIKDLSGMRDAQAQKAKHEELVGN